MTENRLLCLGYGYVARFLAQRLMREGWRAAGSTRSETTASDMAKTGVEPILWGGQAIKYDADAVLISVPPDESGCPALRIVDHDSLKAARWIGYLSTTGVYGDANGACVDESSPANTANWRSKARIVAENEWRALGEKIGVPIIVFRLAGIYGPERSALDRVRAGTAERISKPGHIFNRIHVDDIAAALHQSIKAPSAAALFNLADDEPAPQADVVEYACNLLGVAPPPLVPFEKAQLSPMAKSFYADSKRVSNARMKEALGVRLIYPTYREGLNALAAID
ncbi:MAG: SDR family oxidoreductase [Parvularculaceae bacterium]